MELKVPLVLLPRLLKTSGALGCLRGLAKDVDVELPAFQYLTCILRDDRHDQFRNLAIFHPALRTN